MGKSEPIRKHKIKNGDFPVLCQHSTSGRRNLFYFFMKMRSFTETDDVPADGRWSVKISMNLSKLYHNDTEALRRLQA